MRKRKVPRCCFRSC